MAYLVLYLKHSAQTAKPGRHVAHCGYPPTLLATDAIVTPRRTLQSRSRCGSHESIVRSMCTPRLRLVERRQFSRRVSPRDEQQCLHGMAQVNTWTAASWHTWAQLASSKRGFGIRCRRSFARASVRSAAGRTASTSTRQTPVRNVRQNKLSSANPNPYKSILVRSCKIATHHIGWIILRQIQGERLQANKSTTKRQKR